MNNTDYFAFHEKRCKEDSNYNRAILKQHIQILGDEIENLIDLYELMKIELKALLEEGNEK